MPTTFALLLLALSSLSPVDPSPLVLASPSAAVSSPAAVERPVAGFLPLDDRFLLRSGLLSLPPAPTEVLAGGRWAMTAAVHRSNSFAKSPDVLSALESRSERVPAGTVRGLRVKRSEPGSRRFLIDGELSELELNLRRGLGRGFELGLGLRFLEAGGGTYDGAIEGFHDTFGFGQAGRKGVLRDDYVVYLETEKAVIESGSRPSGFGDLRLGLQWRSPVDGPWDLAVRGMVEVPTGDRQALFSNGTVDLGAQLLASRKLGRGHLHLAVDGVLLGAWEDLELGRQFLLSATAGYERPLLRRSSLLLQLHAGQSPFTDLAMAGLGEDVVRVTLGLKRQLRQSGEVFFAVTENALHYENSADVTLHLGLTTGLGGARTAPALPLARR